MKRDRRFVQASVGEGLQLQAIGGCACQLIGPVPIAGAALTNLNAADRQEAGEQRHEVRVLDPGQDRTSA